MVSFIECLEILEAIRNNCKLLSIMYNTAYNGEKIIVEKKNKQTKKSPSVSKFLLVNSG